MRFSPLSRWFAPDLAVQIGRWLSLGLLIGSVVAPLGLFVWLIFRTTIFSVQAITVLDARPHTEASIRQIIEQAAAVDSGILPAQTIFLINAVALEQKVLADLPQVRSVHITRELPGTVKAVIQEKSPALLILHNTNYYFVDDEGIAYEEARLETLPGLVLPTVKNKDTASTIVIGGPVVSRSFVAFVSAVYERLPEYSAAHVVEISIPSLAAKEVTFRLSNNWELRFDITRNAETQLTILQQLLDGTITAEEKQSLEYLDLRIPNRAYYRTRVPTPHEPER